MNLQKLNQDIRNCIIWYVGLHKGIATESAIDYVMNSLPVQSQMKKYLTRPRVAGNISALVTRYKTITCYRSRLY